MERKENTNLTLLIAKVSVKSILVILFAAAMIKIWFV